MLLALSRQSRSSNSSKHSHVGAKNTTQKHLKNKPQKVLKRSIETKNKKPFKGANSVFIRVIISGFALFIIFQIIQFLNKTFSQSINLSNSFTILVEEASDDHSALVISLRGAEKSINVMKLEPNEARLQATFPIDSTVTLADPLTTIDKQSLLAIFDPLSKSTQSSFNVLDKLKIWQYILTIDSAQLIEQEVNQDVEKHLLVVQKYYSDTELLKTTPTIAVVNATDQNGLAKKVADILNAWGYSVVRVDTAVSEKIAETKLVIHPNEKDTNAVKRIIQSLHSTKIIEDEEIVKSFRSQSVLFIGTDYKLPDLDDGSHP